MTNGGVTVTVPPVTVTTAAKQVYDGACEQGINAGAKAKAKAKGKRKGKGKGKGKGMA